MLANLSLVERMAGFIPRALARRLFARQGLARASSSIATVPDVVVPVTMKPGAASQNALRTAADFDRIPVMKSSEIRRLSQAASEEGADSDLWNAVAARCHANAEQLNYWDIVLVLQAFTKAGVGSDSLFLHFADVLCSKTSRLAPKHVLDIFAVYEAHGLRPRALYMELFHTIIRLTRSMYPEEISLTFQALARYRLGNSTVIAHLVRSAQQGIRDFRLLYLCGTVGALGVLQHCPKELLEQLDSHAKFEVQTVALQELLENAQKFPMLEYSWRPYEELCNEELLCRTKDFVSAEDMDQFVSPFDALRFFQARGLVHDEFVNALCQWCLRGVHRPNVLSERRPTAKELVFLHDVCQERGMDTAAALQDAIAYYVESGGGRWDEALPKPLRYQRKRRYIRTPDPLVDVDISASARNIPDEAPATRRIARYDLPGLPSSEPEQADPIFTEALSVAEVGDIVPATPQDGPATRDPSPSDVAHFWYPQSPRKLSGPSPELTQQETTVYNKARSRLTVRPRIQKYKLSIKEKPNVAMWRQYETTYNMRKKYHPGYDAPRGLGPGKRG